MCSRHHIFPAPLVVTITGHTYGCVRTPTRVAFHRPMTTRHTPPSRMDTEKARARTARPTARSDEWMTAARVDLARASSTFGRPVASLYPASTRSIHEVRESDASSFFFLRARSRPSRARTRRRASFSRRRGWMDGLKSSQPVARNAASGWMGWMTMASRVRARG